MFWKKKEAVASYRSPINFYTIGLVDPFLVSEQDALRLNQWALKLLNKMLDHRIAVQFNSLRYQKDDVDGAVEYRQGVLDGMLIIKNSINELIVQEQKPKSE